jgi:trehalose 6-phosphate phosphatase
VKTAPTQAVASGHIQCDQKSVPTLRGSLLEADFPGYNVLHTISVLNGGDQLSDAQSLPHALASLPDILKRMAGRQAALFLDLDGTLAPIAARPDLVELPEPTRTILEDLAHLCPVAVVSGRGLDDLRDIVGMRSVHYVADHGFQILGTLRSGLRLEIGAEYRPQLGQAAARLRRALAPIEGALVEEKGLSLSVHYRLVPESRHAAVLRAVADVAETLPVLRVTEGKLVYEFRPPGDWNKGKALLWLMEQLGLGRGKGSEGCPIALGDDLTDEDMFGAVQGWGIAVLVGDAARPSLAGYRLSDHLETAEFLEAIKEWLSEAAGGA